jgi:hypothetical protein
MPNTTVTDAKTPKMYITGYLGQSTEQLARELAQRRAMLVPDPIEKERLKRVGRDSYGDVYVDLLSFQR